MTIRFRLTMWAIAVVLVANSLLTAVYVLYLEKVWLGEVQTRVRLDLNAARAAYNGHVESISRFLRAAAASRSWADAVQDDHRAELTSLVDNLSREGGMDFLAVLDPRGTVVYRTHNPPQRGDSLVDNLVVAQTLRQRKPAAGSAILSADALAKEGGDLAARARFTLLPTPAARPASDTVRASGLVTLAAVPLLDRQDRLVGILYGGDLLNRRHEIVDAIKQEVFPPGAYDGLDIGSVTIFADDLRIATNVIGADGERAVGTRLSDEVYEAVLARGETWATRAFVVNQWCITAYEPIRDPAQKVIGALYVGLLEAPFAAARNGVALRFLAMMTLVTATSLGLVYLVALLVLRPIQKIVAMSCKVVAGDLSARVGLRPPGEIGVLCRAVDAMADAVAQRELRLTQAARQQVTRAEKLASIGRLAAGVAHEINNPLTGVLTFAHLLRDKPNMDDQDRQDLELIIHETTRAAEIVRGLLDFARERPTRMEPLDINDVVRRTIRLIVNQQKFEHVAIEEVLQSDLPEVFGDMNQLQQVLLNLSLNACTAMPQGGRLTIATSTVDGQVMLKITDTGCGIKEEHLDRIFEPFFTTQPVGKGTGLGLSVTYGIVEQHGGTIEVSSRPAQGSTFTIHLPAHVAEGPQNNELGKLIEPKEAQRP